MSGFHIRHRRHQARTLVQCRAHIKEKANIYPAIQRFCTSTYCYLLYRCAINCTSQNGNLHPLVPKLDPSNPDHRPSASNLIQTLELDIPLCTDFVFPPALHSDSAQLPKATVCPLVVCHKSSLGDPVLQNSAFVLHVVASSSGWVIIHIVPIMGHANRPAQSLSTRANLGKLERDYAATIFGALGLFAKHALHITGLP